MNWWFGMTPFSSFWDNAYYRYQMRRSLWSGTFLFFLAPILLTIAIIWGIFHLMIRYWLVTVNLIGLLMLHSFFQSGNFITMIFVAILVGGIDYFYISGVRGK